MEGKAQVPGSLLTPEITCPSAEHTGLTLCEKSE